MLAVDRRGRTAQARSAVDREGVAKGTAPLRAYTFPVHDANIVRPHNENETGGTKMACTVLLEIQLKADVIDAAKSTFKEILPDTRAYDGCLGVDVVENQEKSGNLVLVETWESRAKHEKYVGWRAETGLLEQLGAMCEGAPSIRYFDPVDA
jgi:quinol monooxygenase YgiN